MRILASLSIGLGCFAIWQIRKLRESQVVLAKACVDFLEANLQQPSTFTEQEQDRALAKIVEHYGCIVTKTPSGEVYATQGQGEC